MDARWGFIRLLTTALCLGALTYLTLAARGAERQTTPPPPTIYTITPVEEGVFAPFESPSLQFQPASPPYAFDLNQVSNPDLLLELSERQRQALEEKGFVVVPQPCPQIYLIYQEAKDRKIPAFVTTDAMLHTFHILYDYSLRVAELEHFVGELKALDLAMLAASQKQYEQAPGQVREAAGRNLAYFSVAIRLLGESVSLPEEISSLVEAELALIERHEGLAQSPIFGCTEDYSQYVPRGHYTRNETFGRYFKAMMWHGRMAFRLRPGEEPEEIAAGLRETRQAILIVAALLNERAGDELAFALWERIYEPTAFFVGRTDDLNVYDYSRLTFEIYGESLTLSDLADEARLEAFIEKAETLRPPRITSSFVTDQEEPEKVTKAFRFMGQRFVPDSYFFQQLVYNKVGSYRGAGQPFTLVVTPFGLIRGFPRGLDIASVLGSDRAEEIIQTEGDADYEGYAGQVSKLRQEVASLPPEQWTENLYWGWLHSLRPLLSLKGEGYPAFMQNLSWTDKDLQTFLASWAELRHDTILYAKQSMTLGITAIRERPELLRGYVEPQPEVYARLAALSRQMREGLAGRGLLNPEYEGKFARLESLLLALKDISLAELTSQPLTEEDYALIREIGETLEGLTTFSPLPGEGMEFETETDERMAIVADVHTDPNSGEVLEEGVGDAFPIYVLVPIEGHLTLAQGGVFSYHEFRYPMAGRLTDEAWQALEPKPERPAWTQNFIIE